MKYNDPLPKSTEDLLRTPLPASDPRPGFETRLLTNVHDAPERSVFPTRLGIAGLCSLLVAALLLANLRTPSTPAVVDIPEPATSPRPILEITNLPNPFETETTALRNSVTRTGQFLINCFPSLPVPEETL